MNEAGLEVSNYERTSGKKRLDPAESIRELSDSLTRILEMLSKADSMGAIMEIMRAREILQGLSSTFQPPRKESPVGDLEHDWRIVDPYTVECRICGVQRARLLEERLPSMPSQ